MFLIFMFVAAFFSFKPFLVSAHENGRNFSKVSFRESIIKGLKKRCSELKEENKTINIYVEELKEEISNIEKKIIKIEKKMDLIKFKIDELKNG